MHRLTTTTFRAARRASLLLAALAAIAASCSRAPEAPPGPPPMPVTTVRPTVGDVAVYRDYPGIAMSVRTVDIIPRVSGWIDEQAFRDGQEVTERQLLYRIDPRPYEVARERARAEVAMVEAELRNASDRVVRNRPLVEVGAISQQEFDQLLADERSAKARLQARRAALDEANLNLSFTRIESPAGGKASATRVYPGTMVGPEQLLVTVRQMDPLWVEFSPAAIELPAVRALEASGRADTEVALSDGRWKRMGKVVFVDNTVNPDTSTIRTRLEVPNADLVMAPGAYLNVRLRVDELKGAVTVPERAIVYQTAAATLWTVDAERKARQKVVKVGPHGGAGIVILEGVGPDDEIVVEGALKLYDGAQTFDPAAARATP
jgi:membrane fusion protein (multidrug efflux system)